MADVTAILGFSIEPLTQIHAQMASMPHSNLSASANTNTAGTGGAVSIPGPDATLLAERIVKNLFNYVSGFVPGGGAGGGMVTPDSVVPMGVIAKWYEKFLSKVKAGGISFLEREE
jgi:protein Hikeshi